MEYCDVITEAFQAASGSTEQSMKWSQHPKEAARCNEVRSWTFCYTDEASLTFEVEVRWGRAVVVTLA